MLHTYRKPSFWSDTVTDERTPPASETGTCLVSVVFCSVAYRDPVFKNRGEGGEKLHTYRKSSFWSDSVPDQEAWRRASGRRHYNAWRRLKAEYRRFQLVGLARQLPWSFWGRNGAELARRLGVSRSTICRDMKVLKQASMDHRQRNVQNPR